MIIRFDFIDFDISIPLYFTDFRYSLIVTVVQLLIFNTFPDTRYIR